MYVDIEKLPLLATQQEMARALGIRDPRSLRPERLKPVARVVVGSRLRLLYDYPIDALNAAIPVNSNPPPTPLEAARL